MSHPIRKWLKETLQYGRRSVQNPGDSKPPLLWLADLPRLGNMWVRHLWFRTWLDLRTTPSRIRFAPSEVFSPHVQLIRPTRLRPLRPFVELREALARFDRWMAEGGLQKALAQLGNGLLGSLAALIGGIAVAGVALLGSLLTLVAGIVGASAIGTALGLNSIGENVRRLYDRAHIGWLGLWERLKRPDELAWRFATATGIIGLILLLFFQLRDSPQPAVKRVAHRPPAVVEDPEPADAFAELPDPFAGAEPVPDPIPLPDPAPELVAAVERSVLPMDVARFNLPDSEELFVVESESPDLVLAAMLPSDDWLQLTPDTKISTEPVIPAAYGATALTEPIVVESLEPRGEEDQFTPASRQIGIRIEKTQPTQAQAGELLWYELIVTNQSEETLSQVIVEERVEPPHRVADALPAASYQEGLLKWRLDALESGGTRRLQVGIYPMSNDPLITAATIRPISTFSVATYVAEPKPQPAEPEPKPKPDPNLFRRVKIAMTMPKTLRQGAHCPIQLVVTNTGTVPLTGVTLRSELPEEVTHSQGRFIEIVVDELPPGASRTTEFHVMAIQNGNPSIIAEVQTDQGVATTVRGSLSIVDRLFAQR